jgi:hypothetical protein
MILMISRASDAISAFEEAPVTPYSCVDTLWIPIRLAAAL